jgi:hypothetical protein
MLRNLCLFEREVALFNDACSGIGRTTVNAFYEAGFTG